MFYRLGKKLKKKPQVGGNHPPLLRPRVKTYNNSIYVHSDDNYSPENFHFWKLA